MKTLHPTAGGSKKLANLLFNALTESGKMTLKLLDAHWVHQGNRQWLDPHTNLITDETTAVSNYTARIQGDRLG